MGDSWTLGHFVRGEKNLFDVVVSFGTNSNDVRRRLQKTPLIFQCDQKVYLAVVCTQSSTASLAGNPSFLTILHTKPVVYMMMMIVPIHSAIFGS